MTRYAHALIAVLLAGVASVRSDDAPASGRGLVLQQSGQKDPAADALAEQVRPTFEALSKAFRGKKLAEIEKEIDKHFELAKFVDQILATDLVPLELSMNAEFRKAAQNGLAQGLAKQSHIFLWQSVTIRNIKKLPGGNLVVTARHAIDPEGSLKFRWWLTRKQGVWKIYDFEDLDVGMRISGVMVSVVAESLANGKEMAQNLQLVGEAMRDLAVRRDVAEAERKLRLLENAKLPKQFDAIRHLANGLVKMNQGQWEVCLKDLDKAHSLNPDMPCLDLFKAIVYNQLGNWSKALVHLRTYEDLLGDDGLTCQQRGYALQMLGRFSDAAAVYRKGLDQSPKSRESFIGLVQSLRPGDARTDLGARFAKLDNLQLIFDILADECIRSEDNESLTELALAMKRIDPKFAPADYSLALARIWARQVNQAVPLFKTALARQANVELRRRWIAEFMRAMVTADKAVDAYAALSDAHEAFRFLADELKITGRSDDLARLVKVHGKKHGDDPLLPFYEGEMYVLEGRFQLADQAFSRGMARPPEKQLLDSFRFSRLQARYRTGQMLRAYAEFEPKRDAFQQLASLCWTDRKYDQLQTLLDEHAKVDPGDISLLQFRFRVQIKQNNTKEGIALFKSALAGQVQENTRKQLRDSFLMEMVDSDHAVEGYVASADPVHAFKFLVQDLTAMQKEGELQKIADVHRLKHPQDPWLGVVAVEKMIRAKSWDRAARMYDETWNKSSGDIRERSRRFYVEALYRTGRGLEAHKKIEPLEVTYQHLFSLYWQDKKGAELEALVAAHRARVGDKAELYLQLARAKILQKQTEQAIRLFQQAFEKQADQYAAQSYTSMFVRDMDDAGQGLAAYRAVVDKKQAFKVLAGNLLARKQQQPLEALVKEHGLYFSNDLWYTFYLGELHLMRGELDQAERAFNLAKARSRPRDDVWLIRNALFRTCIKAGKVVAMYREIGPGRFNFEDLLNSCIADKNLKQLEALVAVRHQEAPEDVHLPAWDLEVLWLKKDYKGAVTTIKLHRGLFELPRHSWKTNGYLVRGLVKSARAEEAIKEAEFLARTKNLSQVLVVLAHAATGDVKKTMAVMEKHANNRYLVEDCYRDEDLGPILRGQPFQALRTRFPEPKTSTFSPDPFED